MRLYSRHLFLFNSYVLILFYKFPFLSTLYINILRFYRILFLLIYIKRQQSIHNCLFPGIFYDNLYSIGLNYTTYETYETYEKVRHGLKFLYFALHFRNFSSHHNLQKTSNVAYLGSLVAETCYTTNAITNITIIKSFTAETFETIRVGLHNN